MYKLILLLAVVSSAFAGDYSRKEWKHWLDLDKDGQDTRQEVLIEENLAPYDSTEFDERGRIVKGLWICPYTGDSITNPKELDIDHFVPLKEAHESGAFLWYPSQKDVYANFLSYEGHLVAVSASANRSKGARDPSKWMPDVNKCWYLRNWVMIKTQWGLEMDIDEQAFIDIYLDEMCNCDCE